MDALSGSMGMQSIAAGVQANAMLVKNAMIDAEQNAQAILDMLPQPPSPSVNPPHLGKLFDAFG